MPLQAKCTLANATGARLEFFEAGSAGTAASALRRRSLSDYKPPKILEPGAVASFLVDKETFNLTYNIQVFQGPYRGWVRDDESKSVNLGLEYTTNRSAEIKADVQVIGEERGLPPSMYPTKFIFNVYENGDEVVQIFARQLIDQIPRG